MLWLLACLQNGKHSGSTDVSTDTRDTSVDSTESSTDSQGDTGGDTGETPPAGCGTPAQGFVTREGGELLLDGEPFRWISANLPMLTVIEDDWHAPDPWEQHDALCTIAQMGGTVTRTYVISVGASYRHVVAPGQFNEELFEALDQAIAEADATGVRLIIPLVDQWDWWGGIGAYAGFRGKNANDFWSDPQLRADYAETVEYILTRTNTVTGRPYIEEPGILAWETGNELASSADWLAEMAALIRDLDPNHLVLDGHYGVQTESLSNPDVDIVSNHYYSPAPYDEDYAAAVTADVTTVAGEKPFLVGEYGFVATANVQALLDAAEDGGVAGTMIWSVRQHSVEGGFYWHNEVNDGQRYYSSYHWPGFDSGARYDEKALLALLSERAWELQGETVPAIIPEPPEVLSVGSTIQWRGSAGASSYILERGDTETGPYSEVASGFEDAVQARTAEVSDPSPPSVPVWYRMRAVGSGGASEPSMAVYYDPGGGNNWSDTLDNFDAVQKSSNLSLDTTNVSYFGGDGSRLTRVTSGDGWAVWCPGGEVASVSAAAYVWPSEGRPPFRLSVSPDGSSWSDVPFTTTSNGGDWERLQLDATGLPAGTHCVQWTIPDHSGEIWNPQIGMVSMVVR